MSIHWNPDTIENLNKTIRCIEQSDDFDMSKWDTCAKAHAIEAMGRGSIETELVPDASVARFLGLPEAEATKLFLDSDLERDEVIAVLRHFRDTGRLPTLEPCDDIPF
jgi:hypothetical protein